MINFFCNALFAEDNDESGNSNKKNKEVRFDSRVKVVLIPSKEDIIGCGLDLWYQRHELDGSICEFFDEVQQVLLTDPTVKSPREAIQLVCSKAYSIQSISSSEKIESGCSVNNCIDIRILLVDDSTTIQKVMKHLMQQLGYSLDIAGNGNEALEAISRNSYCFVLMDVQMPIKDGADATREIRRHEWGSGTHVPVIGLSGLKDENYRCMESGMDAFIAKPVQRDVLIMIINR